LAEDERAAAALFLTCAFSKGSAKRTPGEGEAVVNGGCALTAKPARIGGKLLTTTVQKNNTKQKMKKTRVKRKGSHNRLRSQNCTLFT
jgi:starvation-inducible outer membrane lipoprotein